MRTDRIPPAIALTLIAGLEVMTAAGASAAQTSAPSPARAGASSADAALVVDGEHFTVRRVMDHQQNDLVAGVFQAPQTWSDRSAVLWNYEDATNPANVVLAVENASDKEGLFAYPAAEFVAVPRVSRQGPTRTGKTWATPVPPAQALSAYAQRMRGALPQFRVMGTRDVPDLPALRQMDSSQHPHGEAVRVAYELQGAAMEEDFYAAYHVASVCSSTQGGRACETDWGLYAPHSFRAPVGTLDRRLPVFTAIQSSYRQNPAWAQRAGSIRAELLERARRSIDAGSERLDAAKARADQIVARSNASLAASDRRTMAIRGGGSGSGGAAGRSSADKADDVIRGVTTLDDPNGGTTQRSSSQQYHWTNGNGEYRDSNDPSYDPNQLEGGGDWHLMNATP